MVINEGLIWDYYECSHACYLFGKFDLPCILMPLSYILLTGIGLWILFKLWSMFRRPTP